MRKSWSNEEIALLRETFPNMMANELCEFFSDRSIYSINMQAYRLNLKKNEKVLKKILKNKIELVVKRNKKLGEQWNEDQLRKIALQYKARGEFQARNNKAYSAIKYRGLLDKLCAHMIPQSYSTPQLILNVIIKKLFRKQTLYNTRKIISPLELDVYVPELKIAFEYNGKYWHAISDNSALKIKKCKKLGIKLIILTENNRRYEEDIKRQLIYNIQELNEWCRISMLSEEITNIFVDYNEFLIDKKHIAFICNKYTEYKVFKKENVSLYNKLLKLKLLETFTSHMSRMRTCWKEEEIKQLVYKYQYLNDFTKDNWGAYQYCRRNNKSLLASLKRKDRSKIYINKDNPKNKPVKQIDKKNGNVLFSYFSIEEAHRKTGVNPITISRCARGIGSSAGGFVWKFLN